MSAFFFQRINDHIQYLRKLEKTLKGEGDFQGVPHVDCKLGQWMYGDGRQEVASMGGEAQAIFDALLPRHEAFHAAGHRALEAQAAGDQDTVRSSVTEMIKLSNTLVDELGKLDRIGAAR